MKQEEYDKINSVRAMLHGFSAAIRLSLKDGGELRIEKIGERLQEGNKTLASILNDHPELYHRP